MKKYVKPEVHITEVSMASLLAQSPASIGIDRTREADNSIEALSNSNNNSDIWEGL